jgi:hypothetical protein
VKADAVLQSGARGGEMKRSRGLGVVLAVLALGCAACVSVKPAPAPPPPPTAVNATCGEVVTANLVLGNDLTCSPPALTVAAGVTVDLNGHTIANPTTSHWNDEFYQPGIEVDGDGVTIRNGTIRGFATGTAGGGTIDHVTFLGDGVRDSAYGSFVLRPLRVTNSTFDGTGTGDGGISLDFGGSDFGDVNPPSVLWAYVGSNTFTNVDTGVDAYEWGSAVIENNVFTGNATAILSSRAASLTIRNNDIGFGGYGVYLVTGNLNQSVRANTIHDNGIGIGIYTPVAFDSGGENNTIADNQLRANGAAGLAMIATTEVDNIVISGNTASGNGFHPGNAPAPFAGTPSLDDGIYVAATQASTVTLARNSTPSNADHGIEATGAHDGGGNTAGANLGSPQCVGISC